MILLAELPAGISSIGVCSSLTKWHKIVYWVICAIALWLAYWPTAGGRYINYPAKYEIGSISKQTHNYRLQSRNGATFLLCTPLSSSNPERLAYFFEYNSLIEKEDSLTSELTIDFLNRLSQITSVQVKESHHLDDPHIGALGFECEVFAITFNNGSRAILIDYRDTFCFLATNCDYSQFWKDPIIYELADSFMSFGGPFFVIWFLIKMPYLISAALLILLIESWRKWLYKRRFKASR